jgi:ribonuclease HI
MQQRLDSFFIFKSKPPIFNPFSQEVTKVDKVHVPEEAEAYEPLASQAHQPLASQAHQPLALQAHQVSDEPLASQAHQVSDEPHKSFVVQKTEVNLFPDAVPMIQPTKDGKRLLYKHPNLPRVGPKGSYQLLVGESDRSEAAWLIQFDGAANPNPGPASSGAVLWSPKDISGHRSPVFESGKYLGKATNNIAEVQGLLLGLQIAAMRGARELLIEGDSELIIFQQTGKYKVSDKNLKVWWANIQAAMMDEVSFDWIAIRQVPREQNERADSITKEVLSRKQSFQRA